VFVEKGGVEGQGVVKREPSSFEGYLGGKAGGKRLVQSCRMWESREHALGTVEGAGVKSDIKG